MKHTGGTGSGQGRVAFTWNGDKAAEAVRAGAWTGLTRAGVVLQKSMQTTVGVKGGFGNRSQPGQPPRVDQNKLRSSITSNPDPAARVVRVGTSNPEGRWMEYGPAGGVIRPKKGKYLPVPMNKKAATMLRNLAGASLRTKNLKFIKTKAGAAFLIEQTPTGKPKKNGAAFALKESVRLLPRPWVFRSYNAARENMNAVFQNAIRESIRGLAKK